MQVIEQGDRRMNNDYQLVGKTITGVVATPGKDNEPRRIWMLQFSDGSHVEFVSPTARRRLIKTTGGHKRTMNQHARAHSTDHSEASSLAANAA
jgi:hypothetical protein